MNVEFIEQLSGAPTKKEQRIFNHLDRVHDAVKSALGYLGTKDANPLRLSPEEEYALRGYVGETLVAIGEKINFDWQQIQILRKGKGGGNGFSMFSSGNLIDPLLDIQEVGQELPEGISKFAPSLTVQATQRLRLENSRK